MGNIGSRIKEARKRRGISQKCLADYICKCPSAVSAYENNLQVPPTEVLISIAQLLNESPNYLLCYETEEAYSVKGLNEKQKEVVKLLFCEYTLPSGSGMDLSKQQIVLIQKLIASFSKSK